MTPPSRLALAALCIAGAAACSAHVAPLAQPVAPGLADTVTISRAPDVLPDTGVAGVREYRGSYSSSFEVSWFEPCDGRRGDALWWVTLSESARADRDSLLRLMKVRPTKGLAVRWLATLSPKMPMGAGHMGHGSRYMFVTRILTLRALDDAGGGACGVPSQSG